jgi:excisionase family DNA binding protein
MYHASERTLTMIEHTHEEQPPNNGGEELLTRTEVARRLRVSPTTVDNWRKRYELPTIEKGYRVFFDWEDVKAWLKSGPMKAIRQKKSSKGDGAKRKRKRKAGGDGPRAR